MPRKMTSLNRDNIIELYKSGMTIKDLARRYNTSPCVIGKITQPVGLPSRIRPGARKAEQHAQEILSLYRDGIGVSGIGLKLNIGRVAINNFFKRRGIKTRNRSQQQLARMMRANPEEIDRLTRSAHDAARNRKQSLEERIKRANTKEKTLQAESVYDALFNRLMIERGIVGIPQKAIGPYNCDLAVNSIAVEIFSGGWHWHGSHLTRVEERFRYILNSGWHIVVFAIDSRRNSTLHSIADYAASFIDKLRCNPPPVCQYWVIWGAGQDMISGSLYDDKITIEPPFTSARDPSTGRYHRVSR